MQTVGQLNQDDTDILGHGQEHFPQVLSLNLDLVRGIGQLSQLGDAVYQQSHIVAEFRRDLLGGHDRILHRVMQKSCHDGLLVKLQIRQDNGHAQGVNDVRLS